MASECFGNGIPKFIGTGTPDSTTRTLYYSKFAELNLSEQISNMFQSPISEKRTFKNKGRHGYFAVEVLLYEFTRNPNNYVGLPNAKTFLTSLLAYEHQDVKFYLSADGPALKNSAGTEITVHVASIEPAFEDVNGLIGDKAIIIFQTNEPYDLSRLLI